MIPEIDTEYTYPGDPTMGGVPVPRCEATCSVSHPPVRCTRLRGHEGAHEAAVGCGPDVARVEWRTMPESGR